MHVALVMSSASGVRTLRSNLIRFLQAGGHRVTAVCALDAAASELRRMNVSLVNWTVSRHGMNPVQEVRSIGRLRRRLAALRPDIILNFTPKVVVYSSLAARLARNTRVFSVLTGLGFLFTDDGLLLSTVRPFLHLAFRFALRNNVTVFFQNPDDQDLFVHTRILPRSRTFRVYGSGVDTRYFVPPPTRKPQCKTTFLMVARLLRHKGVIEYLEAAAILKREGCPAQAVLVGPFDDHPSAIDPATLRSYQDRGIVDYRGATADVRPYLADADVFVLPSYREGTPVSTLEAMAMAKPVITTDTPGCRETVIDRHNGYVVPARDAVKLAAAMRRLTGDYRQIRTMGLRGRQLAEDRYDVNAVNRGLWGEILRTVSDAGR